MIDLNGAFQKSRIGAAELTKSSFRIFASHKPPEWFGMARMRTASTPVATGIPGSIAKNCKLGRD
jgi:hypothetical protein